MLQLKPTDFMDIQHWFVDYQKKSKNFQMPPDEAQILGIYQDNELVGYFILVLYLNKTVEINQGYLKPEARHKALNKQALSLLENVVKKAGYSRLVLGTNRAVGSYQKFMRDCGFALVRAEFAKEV